VVVFEMKRLDIIISHEHIADVNDTLDKNKVGGMTFYDIKGRGHSKYEPIDVGRGIRRYVPEFGSWTKIEVLVANSKAKKVVGDILNVVGTHSASDGKIFVYNVEEAYDIRTKKTADRAL
jgi:nitrogen regulatory protein P-II 1